MDREEEMSPHKYVDLFFAPITMLQLQEEMPSVHV